MQNTAKSLAIGLLMSAAMAGAASAAEISDAVGDFIPTYIGPKNGDLDVVSIQGFYNGVTLRLDATLNGAVGTTPGGLYVWGLQRGAGTARFGAIAPGVLFDSVVSITPGSPTRVSDLASGVAVVLPASATTISGNKISVTFDAATLASLGLPTSRFLINLWPRNGGVNANIADFAPDNSDAGLTLLFPTPDSAAAQNDLTVDDSAMAFDKLATRFRDVRHAPPTGLGGFLSAYGTTGDKGLDGSSVGKHDGWALMGGLDHVFAPGLVIGVMGRGGRTNANIAGGGRLQMDTLAGGLYASAAPGPWRVDGFVGAASHTFKSTRIVPIGSSSLSTTATPKGDSLTGALRLGYAIPAGGWTVTPLADVVFTRARSGAYSEVEPRGFGANVDQRVRSSTRVGFGAAVEQSSASAWGGLYLHASAKYVTEMGDRTDAFAYAFEAQPENRFLLQGAPTARGYGVADVGFDATASSRLRLSVDYQPRFDGHGLMDHQIAASAHLSF